MDKFIGWILLFVIVFAVGQCDAGEVYKPDSMIVCTNATDARESAKVMSLVGECTKVSGLTIEKLSEVDYGDTVMGTWAVFEIRGVGEDKIFYSPSYKSFNTR